MDSADRALGGATPVTMAAAVASSPEVSLHGPKYRGVRKYLGGAPNAERTALIGVPAHDRCVLKLDLETGEVNHLEAKTPKGPFKWLRGVLADDGSVFCIPACASTVLRIHPDGALTHLGEGVLPKSEWKWHGGQKAKDGNIYAVPANAERVLKIEPAENRVSLIGPTFTHTKNKWYGGITAIDGSIWGMPFNAPAALKIVPSTGEVYEVGNVPIGGYKWHGGARCGEYIVGIPSHSMSVLLCHTPTETLHLINHGVETPLSQRGYKWGGGVADGHKLGSSVWAVPSDADAILKITPSEKTVEVVEPRLSTMKNKWQGGVLGRDGHVYCIPCDAPQVLRIDPKAGTYGLHGELGEPCANKFQGAYVHTDGTIWALPESCPQVLRIVPPLPPGSQQATSTPSIPTGGDAEQSNKEASTTTTPPRAVAPPHSARQRCRVADRWLGWSLDFFTSVAELAAIGITEQYGEDKTAGKQLVHALCDATRNETVQEGCFANGSAHAPYVRRNLVSRSHSLASLLLLDVLARGKLASEISDEELHAVANARRALFVAPRKTKKLTILALGGGPCFEAVAIAGLTDFLHGGQSESPLEIEVWVADSEAAWIPTAAAVHRAIEQSRKASSSSLRIQFVHADVTKPLDDPCNAGLSAVIDFGIDLLVCAYVLVETAVPSRTNEWACLVGCAKRLASHQQQRHEARSCHVVCLDATHRVWPEVADALKRGVDEANEASSSSSAEMEVLDSRWYGSAPQATKVEFASWTPRHPITKKMAMLARIGSCERITAEDEYSDLASMLLASEGLVGKDKAASGSGSDGASSSSNGQAHFHSSTDFDWSQLAAEVGPQIEALHKARAANGGAVHEDGEEVGSFDEVEGEEGEEVVGDAATVTASQRTTTTADEQIAGWEVHFNRHQTAPTPFFKERRALIQQFERQLTGGTKATPLTVLEVGCGNGAAALSLLRGNPNAMIHATDPSATAVEQTKHAVAAAGMSNRLTTAVQPTFDTPAHGLPSEVDVAMILFTLSAVPSEGEAALLTAAARALKPGGCLLVRDYGLYDTRHLNDARKSIKLQNARTTHEYLRPGGMHRRYYSLASLEELVKLCPVPLVVEESRYLCVQLTNVKRALTMNRVYVHAVLRRA